MNWIEYFAQTDVQGTTLAGVPLQWTVEADDINCALMQYWPYAKPRFVLDPRRVVLDEFTEAYRRDDLEAYFESRLVNCYLEYRIGSASPVDEEMALPALTLGLVNNIDELAQMTKPFQWADWRRLLDDAAVRGMQAQLGKHAVPGLLADLVRIAEVGLCRRGFGEETYLQVLRERIDDEKTPADRAIATLMRSGKDELVRALAYS